jgi:hypothetical protein
LNIALLYNVGQMFLCILKFITSHYNFIEQLYG